MKWDGIRIIADLRGKGVRLWSRRGNDVSWAFPEVVADLPAAVPRSCVLDGEMVILDSASRPDFASVQSRLSASLPRVAASQAVLLAFDLLEVEGEDLLHVPYTDRRARLDDALERTSRVHMPPAVDLSPAESLALSARMGIEGIVAKRPGSPYLPGRRSRDWRKVTHIQTSEAVVVGWLAGSDGALVSLLLAQPDAEGGWRYIGRVSGLPEADARLLQARLYPLAVPVPPVADPPTGLDRPVRWSRPVVVVDVAMSQWTKGGRMRHPRWRGIRSDRTAIDVRAGDS